MTSIPGQTIPGQTIPGQTKVFDGSPATPVIVAFCLITATLSGCLFMWLPELVYPFPVFSTESPFESQQKSESGEKTLDESLERLTNPDLSTNNHSFHEESKEIANTDSAYDSLHIEAITKHISERRADLRAGITGVAIATGAILGFSLNFRRTRALEGGIIESHNNRLVEVSRVDNERFLRCVELLGSDERTIRLGAISALGQLLASGDASFKLQIIDLISAYSRSEYRAFFGEENENSEAIKALENDIRPPDLQQIINIIGRLGSKIDLENDFTVTMREIFFAGVVWNGSFQNVQFDFSTFLYGQVASESRFFNCSFKKSMLKFSFQDAVLSNCTFVGTRRDNTMPHPLSFISNHSSLSYTSDSFISPQMAQQLRERGIRLTKTDS